MLAAPPVVVQVPLVNANLMTIALESFLYGIFFILAVLSIYLLVSHHSQDQRNGTVAAAVRGSKWSLLKKPMFVTALLLSITCTAHWIMTVIRAFQAFIQVDAGANPLLFYADLHQVTEVVKTGFLMASLWIGDAAIIYRLWIIYGRSTLIVLFPIGTLMGLGVCGIGITYQFTQFVIGEDVFASAAGRWITSDCVFTLVTNLYSTIAIALRVWKSHRATKSYGGVSLMPVLATLVESAAIYTTWTIFFFASYQSGSNLQFPAVDMWPQMSGIAFMLINVRVGLGWAANGRSGAGSESVHQGLSTGRVGNRPQWDQYGGQGNTLKGDDADRMEMGNVARPGRPLEVNITRVMNTERPYDSKVAPFASYEDADV